MLLLLPPEIRRTVLSHVTAPEELRKVLSSCKALRPAQKSRHPTHTEQARMMKECYMHFSRDVATPFDNPFILKLFHAWKAPHTRRDLVRWVRDHRIKIDKGGLYAPVPWRCQIYDANGIRCLRIRVQLWERVHTHRTITLNRYGDTRIVWSLLPNLEDRAYCYQQRTTSDERVAHMAHRNKINYALRSMGSSL